MLPRKIPKAPKRASRWRSQGHANFVRGHECCVSGCADRPIEFAHVRLGSAAGIGQRPDDWNAVSLCRAHHARQHEQGERTFWAGVDVQKLLQAFCDASPKASEIRHIKRERGL